MKPPRSYHPTFVLLFGLATAAVIFGIGFVAKVPPPFGRPFSFLAVSAGLLLGLLYVLREALDAKAGGNEYLRRQLMRRPVYWGRYAWLRFVWWWLFLSLQMTLGAIWIAGGTFVGLAAGYPYWKAHWQRLQRVAQEETVVAEATTP